MSTPDPHSYFDDAQPIAKRLRLALGVDFASRRIHGRATLELAAPSTGTLDLDTKGLTIESVFTDGGAAIPWALEAEEPILGRRLRLTLPAGARSVTVMYETSPDAAGLQWLTPAQTRGKRHPFLFSQCQPIHARTVVPLQDTPRARVTYQAEITVPEALSAVMSAGPAGARPGAAAGTRTFAFEMPQPIPPYLLALAVGELESRDLSPRARGVGRARDRRRRGVGVRRHRGHDRAGPSRSSAPTTGTATTCSCCRPPSRTAAWRTRA